MTGLTGWTYEPFWRQIIIFCFHPLKAYDHFTMPNTLVHLYMLLRFKWFWHCSEDTFLSSVVSFCKIKSKVTYFWYMMGRADVAVVKKEKEYKEGSCQSKTERQPGRHTLPLYVWHPGYGWMKWASYSLHHYSPDNIRPWSILCKIQFDCNESVMSYITATARVLIYIPNLLRKVHNILVFWGPTSIPPLMLSLQNSGVPLPCMPNAAELHHLDHQQWLLLWTNFLCWWDFSSLLKITYKKLVQGPKHGGIRIVSLLKQSNSNGLIITLLE